MCRFINSDEILLIKFYPNSVILAVLTLIDKKVQNLKEQPLLLYTLVGDCLNK